MATEKKAIVHINNTGGVANVLAKEQEKRGHNVVVFAFDPLLQKQFGGILIRYAKLRKLRKKLVVNWTFLYDRYKMHRILDRSEIWHYHSPIGALKKDINDRHNRGRKQGLIIHYHGDEIRNKPDNNFCLVSTPDLLEFAPNSVWLPNPVDITYISRFRTHNDDSRRTKKIAHYPHYKNYGADRYPDFYSEGLKAIEQSGKGKTVEILRLRYEDVLKNVADCDIVIGKIQPSIGWFGKFELEAMTLGKPVICYVSDELYEKYKPPIFRTTKETFKVDLQALIEDSPRRALLSIEGRKFVDQYHDVTKVVNKLEKYYATASLE